MLVLIWAEICSSCFSEATLCIGVVSHSKSLKFSKYGRELWMKKWVFLTMELFARWVIIAFPVGRRWALSKMMFSSINLRRCLWFPPFIHTCYPLTYLVSEGLSAHSGPLTPMMLPEKTQLQNVWWKPHCKSLLANIRPRAGVPLCSL